MGPTSRDLLDLERKESSSSLESTLLVCKNDSLFKTPKPPHNNEKLATTSVPASQVLGKVKDFLGVMGEANKRLQLHTQENSCKEYDIEALTGNETEYIEMDLLLGVADLHTPEAVAAAESAMSSSKPAYTLAAGSSGSESEDSSDDDDSDDEVDDGDNVCSPDKFKKSKVDGDDSLSNDQPKKRPKIIELQ